MESVQFYSLKIRFTKKSEQQKCSDLNVNHCSVLIVNQQAVLACIHDCLIESIGIEDWDRFQTIVEIHREDFETAPEKTDNFMIIELTLFPGRTKEKNEPPLENWGMGGAQKG